MFKIRTFVQTNLKIKHYWLNHRIWFLTNSKSSKVLLILFCSSLFPFRKCESGAVNRTRFKSRLISLESERDRPNCLSVCLSTSHRGVVVRNCLPHGIQDERGESTLSNMYQIRAFSKVQPMW